jgi:(1->4)-alpha-D-glucan 1-alpha-D-glucosylmutase
MSPPDSSSIPRATYRLQFNKDFGFDQAAELAPYLSKLGISHIYASPYLRARPGSTHGYDIVSHTELNPELGTSEAFLRMVAAFKANGLGQILDFVPNHMGVGGADNPWWLNVLEWGPDSEFAGWFDIDWETDRLYLRQKLLVPFLGDHYGKVLQSGDLKLKFAPDEGAFAVWIYDTHKLPICPLHYGRILGDGQPELEKLSDAFAHLSAFRPHIQRCAEDLKAELAAHARHDPQIAEAIQKAVDRLNGEPGQLESWRRLDALIHDQYWRVAHFRVAADDINYRRFFNINDLAGIRIELPELFDHAHSLIFKLLEDGVLDGLRLDHIDGLLDPKTYCLRLREKAPRLPYLVVEKILASHESLRADWRVDGTTGYEFANLVTRLLIDPAGEEKLTSFYAEFTGQRTPFGEIVRDCKLRIMENEMASELNALARDAGNVARSNPLTADFTDNVLRRALKEIVAFFPVYRTYVDGSIPNDADRRDIDWALAQARKHDTEIDPSVFDFLYGLLTCDLIAEPRSGFSRVAVTRTAMRVQQYSGPVMAKGVEDTAFYRFNRLLALNEVGGQPEQFSTSIAAFHYANAERAKRTPHAMLSTSTHDTKRGEDARARLAVLPEIADEWTHYVIAWSRILHAGNSGAMQETPLDCNDEYAFYQLLMGSWPMELSTGSLPDKAAIDSFRQRLEGAMVKAMREAKVHTTWTAPNNIYEEAALSFIRRALDVSHTNSFLDSFLAFQKRVAWFGMHNSLVQTVLKLTVPGMPDIYQGAEFWDLSLVDPDNRRPVDFGARRKVLDAENKGLIEPQELRGLMDHWRDGSIKLRLIQRLLKLRIDLPQLFDEASYLALGITGPAADRICSFARQSGPSILVVAVALFPSKTPLEGDAWNDDKIALPASFDAKLLYNLLDGSEIQIRDHSIQASEIFKTLPFAVLGSGECLI